MWLCDFSVWTLTVTGRFKWLFVVVHCTLLYLQFNYTFPLEESMSGVVNQNSVTPHLGQQNLTNSPGKHNLNFRPARDQVVLIETAANLWVHFFSIFEFGFASGNIEGLREIKFTVGTSREVLSHASICEVCFSHMHMQSEDSRQTRLVFNTFNTKAPLK